MSAIENQMGFEKYFEERMEIRTQEEMRVEIPVIVEEREDIFAEDDFLAKFDEIEVKEDSILSKNDIKYLDMLQEYYRDLYKYYEDLKSRVLVMNKKKQDLVDEWKSTLGNDIQYRLSDPDQREYAIESDMKNCKKAFYNNVVRHIEETYTVKTNLRGEFDYREDGLDEVEITWTPIVEEVISQLGGKTFDELKEEQIVDGFRGSFDHFEYKVSKNKIALDTYIYVRNDDIFKDQEYVAENGCGENLKNILDLFEGGIDYSSHDMNFLMGARYDRKPKGYFKQEFDYGYKKRLKGIKLFKNGRVDLRFVDSSTAREFADRYLNKENEKN